MERHEHNRFLPESEKPGTRTAFDGKGTLSGRAIEQLLGLRLHVETGILMGLLARDGGDALNEIEDALGRTSFFGQHGFDDPVGLGLREAATAEEVGAVLVGAGDEPDVAAAPKSNLLKA